MPANSISSNTYGANPIKDTGIALIIFQYKFTTLSTLNEAICKD
jgi:hypothetical protein